MNYSDICFVCENMANLSLIPLRIYKNGEKKEIFDAQRGLFDGLDPAATTERLLLEETEQINYCVSKQYLYYGAVRCGEYMLILGPVGRLELDSFERRKLKFELGASSDEQFDLMCKNINSLPKITLERFLHILIALNFYINNERKDSFDFILNGCIGKNVQAVKTGEETDITEEISERIASSKAEAKNAYVFERTMLEIIKRGDTEALDRLFEDMPMSLRVGSVGENNLRQEKNIINVTTALVTRAAIEGGMSIEEAFELSDICIKRSEAMTDINALIDHNHRTVCDFCRRVARIRSAGDSYFLKNVTKYVINNLHNEISTEDIAENVFMNPSSLSRKFSKETGKTLSIFIAEKRVEEACWLLENTERSLADIAQYLCFSSQSHFQNTFRRIMGTTPGVYRKKTRI